MELKWLHLNYDNFVIENDMAVNYASNEGLLFIE